MIRSLQVSRGLAALAVVFYHVWLIVAEYSGRRLFESVAAYGLLGVNYFFILSGFIIMMAHQKDVDRPGTIPRYLYRRFARVYPVYWIYLTLYVAAAAIGLGKPDFSWAPGDLTQSYALFYVAHAQAPPPLNVAWTLFYEVRFYLIFCLLLLNRRVGIVVLTIWAVAILILPHQTGYLNYLQSYWNINFLLGMIAFIVSQRVHPRYWFIFLIVGAASLLAIFTHVDVLTIKGVNGLYIAPIGLAFATIVLGFVLLEQHRPRPAPPALKFLGDASYSIYLVHSGAISVMVIVAQRLDWLGRLPDPLLFAFIFIPAVLAGCGAFLAIERPLTRLLRRSKTSSRVTDETPTTIRIVNQPVDAENMRQPDRYESRDH